MQGLLCQFVSFIHLSIIFLYQVLIPFLGCLESFFHLFFRDSLILIFLIYFVTLSYVFFLFFFSSMLIFLYLSFKLFFKILQFLVTNIFCLLLIRQQLTKPLNLFIQLLNFLSMDQFQLANDSKPNHIVICNIETSSDALKLPILGNNKFFQFQQLCLIAGSHFCESVSLLYDLFFECVNSYSLRFYNILQFLIEIIRDLQLINSALMGQFLVIACFFKLLDFSDQPLIVLIDLHSNITTSSKNNIINGSDVKQMSIFILLRIKSCYYILNYQKTSIFKMGVPEDYENSDKYVGVIIAELAATLVFYIILKIIHFCVWGHLYNPKNNNIEAKQEADVDERRWDQQGWDASFPIIFANHVVALAIPILYFPSVFMCIVAFIHFGLFCALVIVNVFIRDLQPGNGSRTFVSRIIWALMCIDNLILFIAGLARVTWVLS